MRVFEANAGIVKNTVLVEMENVNALFHYGTLCAVRTWTKDNGTEYFCQRDGKASSPTTGRAINQFLDKWGNGLEQVQEKGNESTLRDIFYGTVSPSERTHAKEIERVQEVTTGIVKAQSQLDMKYLQETIEDRDLAIETLEAELEKLKSGWVSSVASRGIRDLTEAEIIALRGRGLIGRLNEAYDATTDRQEARLKQKKTSDLVYGVEEYQDDPNFQGRLK